MEKCDPNKTYYKLTDEKHQTYNKTQWFEGMTRRPLLSTLEQPQPLCSSAWIHVYDSPHIAVIMNYKHARFENPVLWECKCSGYTLDDLGMKRGVKSCTTIKQIPLPEISLETRIEFAIRCVLQICKVPDLPGHRREEEEKFVNWAEKWLSGEDRTEGSAQHIYWSAKLYWSAKRPGWTVAEAAHCFALQQEPPPFSLLIPNVDYICNLITASVYAIATNTSDHNLIGNQIKEFFGE
tara:strand:- start:9075 stop:9785 length:711 start_codon:yes stop_codon:yes gene_type:complete